MGTSVGVVAVGWQPLPGPGDLDRLPGLTTDDRWQAATLEVAAARARLAASRSLARRLASDLLGIAPGELTFGHEVAGRPVVGPAGIRMSSSYTDRLAVVAVAVDRQVGVDVEPQERRPIPAGRLWLSDAEQAAVDATPPAGRGWLLLRLWTGKEAAVKALGTGIRQPLRTIDVLSAPGCWRRAGEAEDGAALRWWATVPSHHLAVATLPAATAASQPSATAGRAASTSRTATSAN